MGANYELIIPAHQFEQCDWVVEIWGSFPQITVEPRKIFCTVKKNLTRHNRLFVSILVGWSKMGNTVLFECRKNLRLDLDETTETDLQNFVLSAKTCHGWPWISSWGHSGFWKAITDYSGLVLLSAVFRSTLSHFFATLSVFFRVQQLQKRNLSCSLSFFVRSLMAFCLVTIGPALLVQEKKASFKDCVFISTILCREEQQMTWTDCMLRQKIVSSTGQCSGRDN